MERSIFIVGRRKRLSYVLIKRFDSLIQRSLLQTIFADKSFRKYILILGQTHKISGRILVVHPESLAIF